MVCELETLRHGVLLRVAYKLSTVFIAECMEMHTVRTALIIIMEGDVSSVV